MIDLSSTASILVFLQGAGYFALLLTMTIEGPVITAVAAFAASLGLFHIYYVFGLSVLGNLIGDVVYFSIGKFGRKVVIDRYLERFKVKKDTLEKIERDLKNHPGKAMAVIKIIPPLPTPGLILAGVMNMPFKTFLFYSFVISFFYSLFFAVFGFYAGQAFHLLTRYSRILEIFMAAAMILAVTIWLIRKNLKGNALQDYNKMK
ncbi:MAG: DedA family protein [Patescibacteria group bacterium]